MVVSDNVYALTFLLLFLCVCFRCLYYPAFMTNGFRGSIIPCHFVAGSKDFVIDPLAFHPAINKYYRFSCTAKGREADAYMLTLYMVKRHCSNKHLAVLSHCFFFSFSLFVVTCATFSFQFTEHSVAGVTLFPSACDWGGLVVLQPSSYRLLPQQS